MSENIPQEVMEDWYVILQRPGMNVLATHLSTQLAHLRSQLESTQLTATFEKVREIQGEMKGVRKVMQFVKSEFNRAAKGDTPEKEK